MDRTHIAGELLTAAKEMTAYDAFELDDIPVYLTDISRIVDRLQQTVSRLKGDGKMELRRVENGLNKLTHEAEWLREQIEGLL